MRSSLTPLLICLLLAAPSCGPVPPSDPPEFDLLIRGGTLLDGSGAPPRVADLGIRGDTIVAVGSLDASQARRVVEAEGLAVAPGFINMLSWAVVSLIADGRSLSDIRQGVTLEIFGEGQSMGPLNDAMKHELLKRQGAIRYEIDWTTLGEYLERLEQRGVSPNVASFVGATTVRVHELGYEDRAPDAAELERMRGLVREAMEEGALGVGSSLIYTPAAFADTAELIALAEVAAEYGGTYISHIRSEGDRILKAVDELITIAREAGIAAEIYHLKAAGRSNWDRLDQVIERVEQARGAGLSIGADIYTYTAGRTGLDAAMPPWVKEGGHEAWVRRLQDPDSRERVLRAMTAPGDGWENLYHAAGSPENIRLVEFRNESLRPLTGKTLAEVAALRGTTPEETALDLVIEDDSRVGTIYFLMSEDNVRKKVALPWVSFGSDEASVAAEGQFLEANPHPRAYGTFARLLGRYVRDEGLISLQEAVRRLTSLPADNLGLDRRGRLEPGYFADVVVFDPDAIHDRATYDEPHRYSTGMVHVFVNGVQVLEHGEHTGATPGRVIRGPGWRPTADEEGMPDRSDT